MLTHSAMKIASVNDYLKVGCGRCPFVATPRCKVNDWRAELKLLRALVLECGLLEELKWSVPCYTINNRNVLIVSALREYCSLSFFKGSLMRDPNKILVKPGENSQAAMLIKFTSLQQINELDATLREYILEAAEIERSGQKVNLQAKHELQLPDELLKKFEALPALKRAFESLTPGRQRGYVLFFSAAKQAKTRESRIEKWIPSILEGRGMHD